jgi:hypothetical protein
MLTKIPAHARRSRRSKSSRNERMARLSGWTVACALTIAASGTWHLRAQAVAADAAAPATERAEKPTALSLGNGKPYASQPGRLLSVTLKPFEIGNLGASAYGDQVQPGPKR